MKKLYFVLIALALVNIGFAQVDTTASNIPAPAKKKKDWSKVDIGNRPNDHFLVQIGFDGWAQKPDSIRTKGLARSLGVYFMLDFPFKTDPRFSVGLGAGISGSSIYFDKMEVDVAGTGTRLNFRDVSDTNYFKKYKLTTAYLEAPLELRFVANPENTNKSWKFALGVKIGTMINAHNKGKNLVTRTGNTINSYTRKETSKRYFNGTRMAGTVRFGYGNITLFGQYQLNQFIKDGVGPNVRPYAVGLTFSGL